MAKKDPREMDEEEADRIIRERNAEFLNSQDGEAPVEGDSKSLKDTLIEKFGGYFGLGSDEGNQTPQGEQESPDYRGKGKKGKSSEKDEQVDVEAEAKKFLEAIQVMKTGLGGLEGRLQYVLGIIEGDKKLKREYSSLQQEYETSKGERLALQEKLSATEDAYKAKDNELNRVRADLVEKLEAAKRDYQNKDVEQRQEIEKLRRLQTKTAQQVENLRKETEQYKVHIGQYIAQEEHYKEQIVGLEASHKKQISELEERLSSANDLIAKISEILPKGKKF